MPRFINNSMSSQPTVHKYTSTENQSVFTVPTYENINVFIGGVQQFAPDNYTKTSNTSIALTEALPAGENVTVEIYN